MKKGIHLLAAAVLLCTGCTKQFVWETSTPTKGVPAVSSAYNWYTPIPLGWKTDGNTPREANDLANRSGYPVVARMMLVLTDATGLEQINSIPNRIPVAINMVYLKGYAPPSYEEYVKKATEVMALIKRPIQIVYLDNEEIGNGYASKIPLYAKMVKFQYDYWMPRGAVVGTGGTPIPMLSRMIERYYLETGGQAAADEFMLRWFSSVGSWYSRSFGDSCISELKELQRYNMPELRYGIHWNLQWENVDFLPEMLTAVRYYARGYSLHVSELSSMYQSEYLIEKGMGYLTRPNQGIKTIMGYSRYNKKNAAVPYNEPMKDEFVSYNTFGYY